MVLVANDVELRVVPACRSLMGFDGVRLLEWASAEQVDVTEGVVIWEIRKKDPVGVGSVKDRVLLGSTPSDYNAVVLLQEPLSPNRVYVAYLDQGSNPDQLYADFTLADLKRNGFYHYATNTERELLAKAPSEFDCNAGT